MAASIATGIKVYFAKRMFSNVMIGYHHEELSTVARQTIIKDVVFIELSIGINIFKSYPNPKPEEIRE